MERTSPDDQRASALPNEDALRHFRLHVEEQGRKRWRDLPWRNIDDPYSVLVSEIMLQQTQVKRVLGYWTRFLDLFPTLDALASADTSLVLEVWQGLGYNRRALSLKRLAVECSLNHKGTLPHGIDELLELPGVGPATAGGVVAFAYNEPCVYLETNVRSVFLHHFFAGEHDVPDGRIVPLVQATCPCSDVRRWYYALLDYGSHLKTVTANPSRRSRHYSRQSTFEGSRRQKRAELLRLVLGSPGITETELCERLGAIEIEAGRERSGIEEVRDIIASQVAEGFFVFDGEGYRA